MTEFVTLTKRHIKTYLRDKLSVFFSFLSIIILLAIYLLFLGEMFNDIPNLTTKQQSQFLVGYIMGGVLVVGTITLSLGVLGTYVYDLDKKRINGFLVTPINRTKLVLSYYVATVIVTFVLTLIMFLLTFLYLGIFYGVWYSFLTFMQATGLIALYVLISIPVMIFLVTFVKSSNAYGALSSIVGTLIGFLAGIYIPITALDEFTQTIATFLPFSHMTMYMREVLIGKNLLSLIPSQALLNAGIVKLKFVGLNINGFGLCAIFLGLSALLIVISYLKMSKKSK